MSEELTSNQTPSQSENLQTEKKSTTQGDNLRRHLYSGIKVSVKTMDIIITVIVLLLLITFYFALK